MTRTKWMRLGVRDAADILRWAGEQDARRLDEFRYRVIGGREFISFRMVPRYSIEIGTSDIVVVAHVDDGWKRRLLVAAGMLYRRAAGHVRRALAALGPRERQAGLDHSAELYQFAPARISAPTRR